MTTTSQRCGCGCGAELAPRRDGSYANYAPGGHDAKHKSQLVRAALEGDQAAIDMLAQRNWTKFLEKAQARREKDAKKGQPRPRRAGRTERVSDVSGGMRLSETHQRLLEFPPGPDTWVCVDPDDAHHGGAGDLAIGPNDTQCWFCHRSRTDDSPLLMPRFEQALKALRGLNWADIELTAQIFDPRSPQIGDRERKLLRLRDRYLEVPLV